MNNYENEKILNFVHDFLNNQGYDISNISNNDRIDIDSISFICMIVEFEERFELTIPDQILSIENFNTIEKMISIFTHLLCNTYTED